LNGKVLEGPRWVQETYDFMGLPLLVRPNSVIPIGRRTDKPDYDYSDGITLQIYPLEDGHSTKVETPSLDGKIETTFEIARTGPEIHIQKYGPAKEWNVSLAGDPSAQIELEAQTEATTIRLT
jgi:alpha-D-xyloside xylohydrolase